MSDSLRDRIAAVLYEQSIRRARMSWQWKDATHPEVRKRWLEDADAVIAELNLSVTGGVIVGCLHD